MLKQNCEAPLEEADGYMGYRIDIQEGIRICGFDERGVAQGLYFLEDLMNIKIHVKQFHILKLKMLSASDKETMNSYAKQIEKIALEEVENARDTIPLVKADSRLGWEPCMEYLGDAEHIQWKIKQVYYMLEHELKKYLD
jgi:hypothetical protein